MEMAEEGEKVTLNVYDISQGLARKVSAMLIGKTIEGIWHTGIVVYDNEYYFGGGSVRDCPVGTIPYGNAIGVINLGVTHVPKDIFEKYLQEILIPQYTPENYKLLTRNCNNFANEIAQFLVGTSIPDYILNLPNEIMTSPMGDLLMPVIQNFDTTILKTNPFGDQGKSCPKPLCSSDNGDDQKEESVDGVLEIAGEDPLGGERKKVEKEEIHELKNLDQVLEDPLGDKRKKVQEEICREFAAIMATGTLRVSEAATLAAKKAMQNYANLNG